MFTTDVSKIRSNPNCSTFFNADNERLLNMLKLADWIQNKWQVMALNNDHNRNKNLPPIEEPEPFSFHDMDINKMNPSKLKDCISINLSNSNNQLFDDNFQIENNEENDDLDDHSQLYEEYFQDYDHEDNYFEHEYYYEPNTFADYEEDNAKINDEDAPYEIEEETFNDGTQETNIENNCSPFDDIDDDFFVQIYYDKQIMQNNNKRINKNNAKKDKSSTGRKSLIGCLSHETCWSLCHT